MKLFFPNIDLVKRAKSVELGTGTHQELDSIRQYITRN
jgi:hypothetical protein